MKFVKMKDFCVLMQKLIWFISIFWIFLTFSQTFYSTLEQAK